MRPWNLAIVPEERQPGQTAAASQRPGPPALPTHSGWVSTLEVRSLLEPRMRSQDHLGRALMWHMSKQMWRRSEGWESGRSKPGPWAWLPAMAPSAAL